MKRSSHRNESLDVLRCIAVLLVVGYHLPYYRVWARVGWIGVDLFFVLSGFLISGLLFEEYKRTCSISMKRFLIRRSFKIYPSFYLLIVLVTCLFFMRSGTVSSKQLLANWFFAQNYIYDAKIFIILGHTWSLAVEEHFYLVLPLLLLALMVLFREPFRFIPPIFALIAVGCLACRCLTLGPDQLAWMTHMRIDSLFAGVTLGYLYHFRRDVFEKLTGHYALVVAVMLCAPAFLFDLRAMQTFGLTGLYVGFGFLIAWSIGRTPKSVVGRALSKCAAMIGFYSYSIYLWHTVIVDVFEFYPPLSATKFWAYTVTTIILGIAMARLVEMPYLALREKRFPSPESAGLTSVSCPEIAALSPAGAKST
jgi:peptidoglycan/LPS O-acetylase OafA/YrhL